MLTEEKVLKSLKHHITINRKIMMRIGCKFEKKFLNYTHSTSAKITIDHTI